jgi:hypothetical protein
MATRQARPSDGQADRPAGAQTDRSLVQFVM